MPRLFKSALCKTNYIAFDRRCDGKPWAFPSDDGRSWQDFEIPKSAHVIKWVRKGLGDFFRVMDINAVSSRLGEIIKAAAPNDVELYPIDIVGRKNEVIEGAFYLLNILSNVYAVDYHNTPGRLDSRSDGMPILYPTEERLVLFREKLPKSTIWQDGALGDRVFVSGDLASLIEQSGFDVFTTTPIIVVAEAEHVTGPEGQSWGDPARIGSYPTSSHLSG